MRRRRRKMGTVGTRLISVVEGGIDLNFQMLSIFVKLWWAKEEKTTSSCG